jgi:acyl-CoA thioesterase FadM
VNLYLRLLRVLLILPFLRKRGLLEASRIAFRVWPTDCDLNLHMNNGRYLTFMDLGRVHLLGQTKLWLSMWRRRWFPVLGAAEINYIRPIRPLQKFELVSRLLTWDEKYFYIEQRFEVDRRLHAIALVKGVFLAGRVRVDSDEVLRAVAPGFVPPDIPEVVRHWNTLTTLKKQTAPDPGKAIDP